MTVVIMAGGKGTRIASLSADVPKPMLPLAGKPMLEHQLDVLRGQGYTDFILAIGHLGHVVRDYFGDGAAFGVRIRYITEQTPLGTAGAMFYLKEMVEGDFLLLNGDILFDVDIARFARAHAENAAKGGLCTIFTHPNNHPFDSGIVEADDTGRVTRWLHKEDERLWYQNRVNAGLHMCGAGVLAFFPEAKKTDLDRDILKPMIPEGRLYAYDSPEYVKDMGTPERFAEAERDLAGGLVGAKNLARRQKAVFLDRDGVLNRYVGFLRNIDDFELLDGVGQALARINHSGYLAVVATNQPVVARGEVSFEELRAIHNKMETLLGHEGAYIDGLYFCPHHPHSGFAGERPELKGPCACRKPKPGMLLKAAGDLNIDLAQSWMVGDGDADIEAGLAAGCRVARIGGEAAKNEPVFPSLLAFVNAHIPAGAVAGHA